LSKNFFIKKDRISINEYSYAILINNCYYSTIFISVAGVSVAGVSVAGVSVATGISVAGVSVAGVSVVGVSVAGVSVAGVSVAGTSVAGVSVAGTSVAGVSLDIKGIVQETALNARIVNQAINNFLDIVEKFLKNKIITYIKFNWLHKYILLYYDYK
jgi:hypothetical protein